MLHYTVLCLSLAPRPYAAARVHLFTRARLTDPGTPLDPTEGRRTR